MTQLRDAIITRVIARSLRRALEITEFTLGEWRSRVLQEDETSTIKVKIYKTMSYGAAEFMLNTVEEGALKAYVMYARPLVTDCKTDSCPVFTSTLPASRKQSCCVKLDLSNVTTIVKKVALKAGVAPKSVNTRMLRRSTIADAWQRNPDPSFRQKLSQLAGHSYETARRYYATFDTSEQSRKVVNTLDEYRQ